MRVAELIERLKELPQDAYVLMDDSEKDYLWDDVAAVMQEEHPVVVLTSVRSWASAYESVSNFMEHRK